MTVISAFDDAHLDDSIAAILRLPAGAAGKPPARDDADKAASWWRFIRSRQASVTVVAALGIASVGAVVILVRQNDLLTNGFVAKTPSTMRRVVDLAVPVTPSSLSDTVAETAITVPPHRWHRRAWTRRPAHPSSVEPASEIVDAAPLVSQPAPEDLVDRGASATIVAEPTVPVETPVMPRDVAEDQTTASTAHARRDSIDAIRALRRQY